MMFNARDSLIECLPSALNVKLGIFNSMDLKKEDNLKKILRFVPEIIKENVSGVVLVL